MSQYSYQVSRVEEEGIDLPEVIDGFRVIRWHEVGDGWTYPVFDVPLYGCGCPDGADHAVHVAGDRFGWPVQGEAVFWLYCETCQSEV